MNLSSGDVIGDWLIEGVLGEGSMGVVYRCRDREHRSIPVAVKVGRANLPLNAIRRFQREGNLIKQLDHPAVIQFYSQGTDKRSGLHWLAMELLDGLTFRDRMQYGPLSAGSALAMFTPVVEGLAHAHARNIFHRDLKPSNLFLCRDNSSRILDFGTGLATELSPLTGGSQEIGTYAYMPPEIFLGQRFDPALGDVYGVGLVLYEMLIGQEIFVQPFPQMTSLKIQSGPLDPGGGVPVRLRQTIINATHPEPRMRTASMQELSEQLMALALEHPLNDREPLFPTLRAELSAEEEGPTSAMTPLDMSGSPISSTVAPELEPGMPEGGWWLGSRPVPVSREQVIDLITNSTLDETTRIARPGSVWREVRYHPNFRDCFTPGSEMYAHIQERREASRVQVCEAAEKLSQPRRRRRQLLSGLGVVCLIAVVGALWPTPEPPPSPEALASAERAVLLQELVQARSPEPTGDPMSLLALGQASLRQSTFEGAEAALRSLESAAQLSTDPQITATLAEASSVLAGAEPQLFQQARLAVEVAEDQGATPAQLAPARMALALAEGQPDVAMTAARHCGDSLRCAVLLAEARRDLEELSRLESEHSGVIGLPLARLRVLIAQESWLAVQALSMQLTQRLPDEALPHYGMALSAAILGDRVAFEQAVEQGTLRAPGWLALRHLHARQLLRQERSALASSVLQSLVEDPGFDSYPERGAVWRDLVVAAEQMGDLELEAHVAEEATRADQDSPIGWMQKAWVHHRSGEPDRARRALEAVDLSGLTGEERAHAGLLLARILDVTEQDTAVLAELSAITEAYPGSVEVWLSLCGAAMRSGNSALAISALQQAALQDNLQVTTLDPFGTQLWRLDVTLLPDPDSLTALITTDPVSAEQQQSLLGLQAWLMGDPDEAEVLLDRARRTEAPSAAVLSALGQRYLSTGRYRAAAERLGASVRMTTGRPAVVAMYSYAMAAAGDHTTADRLSDLYKTPNRATVYWKVRALQALGEDVQARQTLEAQIGEGGLSPESWQLLRELQP